MFLSLLYVQVNSDKERSIYVTKTLHLNHTNQHLWNVPTVSGNFLRGNPRETRLDGPVFFSIVLARHPPEGPARFLSPDTE